MKIVNVEGTAVPQVCHTQADAAGTARAGGAGARLATVVPALPGVKGAVDRFIRGMGAQRPLLSRQQPVVFVVQVPDGHAASVAGYAPPRRGVSPPSGGAPGTGGTSPSGASSHHGDWDFLDDPKLSMEDKLFRFMKLVVKKNDDELMEKMKAFKSGRATGSGGSGESKSSGGLFGFLKQVIPPLGALEKVIPGLPGMVDQVAGQLGPQLLGALMIPLGAPWAAPLVQRAASALLPAALDAAAGGSGASSGSAGSSGLSKESDERIALMEIERLMQKTNQMFGTVSNVLKATHDAAMTAVNNIR